jgi:hypothetical protein
MVCDADFKRLQGQSLNQSHMNQKARGVVIVVINLPIRFPLQTPSTLRGFLLSLS